MAPEARREVACLFPDGDSQGTHGKTFDKNCGYIENLGGDISHAALQNRRLIIGCFPWKFQGDEAAFARVVSFEGEWPKEV